MPNITSSPAVSLSPAQAMPDIVVERSHDATIYSYVSASGTVNDVAAGFPSFVGNVRLVVTLPTGDATWTGLQAGSDGQRVMLWNNDANSTLILSTDDAGSIDRNRFKGTSLGYGLSPGFSIDLIYFAGSVNGWVVR